MKTKENILKNAGNYINLTFLWKSMGAFNCLVSLFIFANFDPHALCFYKLNWK